MSLRRATLLSCVSIWLTTVAAAADVELAVVAPTEQLVTDEVFHVTVTLSWPGPATTWVVKDMTGPTLAGLRECGHRVSARVDHTESGPISHQTHSISLVAHEAGRCTVGPIEVTLLGEGGKEQRLRTKALQFPVERGFFAATLGRERVMAFAALVVAMLVVWPAFRRYRRGRSDENRAAGPEADDEGRLARRRLGEGLDGLAELARKDDCKRFYREAMALLCQAMAVNGVEFDEGQADDVADKLAELSLSEGRRKGLQKVVADAHLVKFAGLRPELDEREQVHARLHEFISPLIDVSEEGS